jgi:hypothetical protein
MSQLDFIANNVDVDIDSDSVKPDGFEFESHSSKTDIKYLVTIEARSWGIKSLCYITPSQEITMSVDLLKTGEEDYEDYTFKVTLTEVETDGPEDLNGDLAANNLTIKFEQIERLDDRTFKAKATATISF